MKKLSLGIGLMFCLSGCSSVFSVKSEPLQADVSIQTKTGEKKPLGKTPLLMSPSDLRKAAGNEVDAGGFFTVVVEKKDFVTESFRIPATRFGTTLTALDVKLKAGTAPKEAGRAKDILDHLFLAQKLAVAQQYERAQIEIDKILTDFPDFPRALSMRASIYMAQKNYGESAKWFEEALKADPQMEDTVRMLAKVKTLQNGGRLPASTTATPATTAPDKKP